MENETKKSRKPCIFFWQHEWTKWHLVDGEITTIRRGTTTKVPDVQVQMKECARCGLVRLRKLVVDD